MKLRHAGLFPGLLKNHNAVITSPPQRFLGNFKIGYDKIKILPAGDPDG